MTDTTAVTAEDVEAISSVLEAYLEGGRRGDASIMRDAYRDDATIHGQMGDELIAGPIAVLFEWIDASPPAAEMEATITNVDVAHTIATARVEITNWLGHRFTDQFTLFKEGGRWVIVSKVFHVH